MLFVLFLIFLLNVLRRSYTSFLRNLSLPAPILSTLRVSLKQEDSELSIAKSRVYCSCLDVHSVSIDISDGEGFSGVILGLWVRNYKPGTAFCKASVEGYSHGISRAAVWTGRRLASSLVKISYRPSGYFAIVCIMCGVTHIFSGYVLLTNIWHPMGNSFYWLFFIAV